VRWGAITANVLQKTKTLNKHKIMLENENMNEAEALQFYEDCADKLPYYQTSEKDNGFDWDRCRAYCSVGKSYSHSRFMSYVAEWFGTTVNEMKLQWRNVK
jgi:hypothetical protein